MAVFSGKDGKVLIGAVTLASITKWTFNTEANTDRFAHSGSSGYKVTVAGSLMGDGTIEGKVDAADPITDDFTEGSGVTLLLYLDATRFYSVPSIIKRLQYGEVDIDNGVAVPWNASFETNGAWTLPTY